ncbi:Rid family hydrolase [Acetobacter conturbans]|uniref:Rid family hydrolase n=1 Tax=Acetobacter conturbans TaxID=1737472 RepID=UPI001F54DA13|nr:Rid family hydrolase [Acetobacter conturbans]
MATRRENDLTEPLPRFEMDQPTCEQSRQNLRLKHLRGYDRRSGRFPARIADQCRLAFCAGDAMLSTKGASLRDVVRVTYLVKNVGHLSTCGSFVSDMLGDNRPATTVLVVEQFDRPEVEIELELTARMPEVAALS